MASGYTGVEELPNDSSRQARAALDLLVDDTRMAVVAELRRGEAGVAEIARAVRRSPVLVRHALGSLKDAGLLRVRSDPHDRRRNLYAIDPRAARGVLAEVACLLGLEAPPLHTHQGPARVAPFPSGLINLLSSLPYFSEVPPIEIAELAARTDERSFKKGEMVFCEGQACQGLYVVKSGLVKVFKTSPDGKEQVLRLVGPGKSFNEVPAFDGGPCPASAQALENSNVCVVPRPDLVRLMHRSPAFSVAAVQAMASHLRHLVSLVEDLSFRSVTARVAKILLQTTRPDDGVGAGADRRGRLTQQDMAQMAGTAREVVARALKALERAGAIRQHRGNISILDTSRLARFTSQPGGACCPSGGLFKGLSDHNGAVHKNYRNET